MQQVFKIRGSILNSIQYFQYFCIKASKTVFACIMIRGKFSTRMSSLYSSPFLKYTNEKPILYVRHFFLLSVVEQGNE